MQKPDPEQFGASFAAPWAGYLWSEDSQPNMRRYLEAYDAWQAKQKEAQRFLRIESLLSEIRRHVVQGHYGSAFLALNRAERDIQ